MNTFMDRVNAIVQSNQAPMAQNVSYPDAGIGALSNVANGVPRQTMIANQPHMLAYINPEEEQMLYAAGGSGEPGPGGVPAFRTLGMSPGEAGARGGGYQGGDTVGLPTGGYSDNNDPAEKRFLALAAAKLKTDAAEKLATETIKYVEPESDSFTPTKAELDASIAAAGGVNLTGPEYAETVDFTNTGSGNDYTPAAGDDTDVSGFEFVANTDPVTGENTTDTLASNAPLPFPVDLTGVVNPTSGPGLPEPPAFKLRSQNNMFSIGDPALYKDYRSFGGSNFTGYDLTNGGNTVGYSLGQDGSVGGTITIVPSGGFDLISLDNSTTTFYATLSEAMTALNSVRPQESENLTSTEKALRAGFDSKKDLDGVQVAANSLVTNDAGGDTGSDFDEIDDGTGTDFSLVPGGVTEEIKKGDDLGALPVIQDPKTETRVTTKFLDTTNSGEAAENTPRENLANWLTPFDGAKFVKGQLIDEKTGEPLTGGGFSSTGDYIYGVSDSFDNNYKIDIDNLSRANANAQIATQKMLMTIPPSDLSYFASFIPGMVIPVLGVGGVIGEMMLTGGIEERRAYMKAEIAALEAGATPLYNEEGEYLGHDQYNLNYDPTGGNAGATATGALPTATAEDVAASAAAGEEAAASMKEAGILTVGGKQTPGAPDNVGNTPIFQYNGSDESGEISYEVVGGLTEGKDATLSTNADGTLFIPYDSEDPHTITADTAFIGSTDPNAADYNMSLDLAENGSYVNLDGDTVTGDAFETDLTPNGAAVANVVGKNILLTTGDDSKMVVGVEGGGYQLVDGTPLTNKVLENIITEGVNDGTLSADLLDTFGIEGGAETTTTAIDTDTDTDTGTGTGTPVVSRMFDRFFRSGSSAGLPAYMAKWMDGIDFNERLEKVMKDGQVVYINSKGETIPTEYLESTLRIDEDGNIIETDE